MTEHAKVEARKSLNRMLAEMTDYLPKPAIIEVGRKRTWTREKDMPLTGRKEKP